MKNKRNCFFAMKKKLIIMKSTTAHINQVSRFMLGWRQDSIVLYSQH